MTVEKKRELLIKFKFTDELIKELLKKRFVKSFDALMILKLLLEVWDVLPKSNVYVRS